MKKTLLFILLLYTALPAFTQNDVVDYYGGIQAPYRRVKKLADAVFYAQSFEQKEQANARLLSQLDTAASVVKKLGGWKGDASLQQAILDLFAVYKALAETDYPKLNTLLKNSYPGSEEVKALELAADTKEQDALRSFRKADNEFQVRWGLAIMESPPAPGK